MKKRFAIIFTLIFSTVLLSGCFSKGDDISQQPEPKTEDNIVYLVQAPPPNMLEQLKAKEIDGFIAWEPFDSVAVSAGDGKYLFKSPDVWKDHPCCVLAVSDEYKDAKTIEAFTWTHIKAIRFINDPANKEKVLQYAADFTGKDKEVVKQALENITYVEYPAEDKFKEYYTSLEEGKLLKKSVTDVGFTDSDNFFANFLNESVYTSVSGQLNENANWVPEVLSAAVKLRLGYLTNDLHQLAFFVAEQEGYYKQIGLESGKNLEKKVFPNGVAVMEAFKAKDVDIAYLGGAPATLKRINDNIDIGIIAGANNEGSALVVRTDMEINSVADLRGKTIAVPGVGTVQYTLLEKALKQEGLRSVLK